MIFSKIHIEKSLSRQDVHGKAAVPEGYAEAELGLLVEVELILVDGDFEDTFESGFGDELGIHQADKRFFDRELLKVAALKLDDDGDFFRGAYSDAKLWVFEFAERFGERVNAHAEAAFLKTVAQFVEIKDPAVHGAAAPLRRIEPRAKPFEIGSVATIHGNVEQTGGRELQRVFWLSLDGFG